MIVDCGPRPHWVLRLMVRCLFRVDEAEFQRRLDAEAIRSELDVLAWEKKLK